jgi:hypothetical protein
MSLASSGRKVCIWLRTSRSATGSPHFAAVAGAWVSNQAASAASARSIVGQMGQSVSSRSRVMARTREGSSVTVAGIAGVLGSVFMLARE